MLLRVCITSLNSEAKMTRKGKHFKSNLDTDVVKGIQLKTLMKEAFQDYFRKCPEQWVNMFEARESVLRGHGGNATFTIVILKIKHI